MRVKDAILDTLIKQPLKPAIFALFKPSMVVVHGIAINNCYLCRVRCYGSKSLCPKGVTTFPSV